VDDRLMYRREFYIGGRWTPPAGSETFQVISPSTETVVGEVPLATTRDMDRAVDAAHRDALRGAKRAGICRHQFL
jgi:acyl-CoA reductase-like NAD-dependent aldehyde dehydrogenase